MIVLFAWAGLGTSRNGIGMALGLDGMDTAA